MNLNWAKSSQDSIPKKKENKKKRKKLVSQTFSFKKVLCFVKDTIKRMKSQAINQEKTFTNHITNKGFIPRTQKELSKFNNKTDNPIKYGSMEVCCCVGCVENVKKLSDCLQIGCTILRFHQESMQVLKFMQVYIKKGQIYCIKI